MGSPVRLPARSTDRSSKYSQQRVAVILICGGVVTLLLLGTCGRSAYHSYRIADNAAQRFHGQLDRGEYEDAYGEATDEFRNAGSRQQQIAFFQTVHDKMGNCGKRSIQGFHVTVNTSGTFVSAVYRTEFAAGSAREDFVWRIDQGQPRLWSYHIDSPVLR